MSKLNLLPPIQTFSNGRNLSYNRALTVRRFQRGKINVEIFSIKCKKYANDFVIYVRTITADDFEILRRVLSSITPGSS